ncbi:Egg protein [Schistosoma japonicum]|nr:Egg protein [Schistosoma japonicum]
MKIINMMIITTFIYLNNSHITKSQVHDGNARTGTPDVSRASKPTVLVVEVFTAKLMIARTKQNLKWYPTYENKHSQEFQQLSNEVCEALLQYANSIVPTGSDGGKCENPIFIPTYGTPYAAVSTKLKIVFEYINVPRIEAKLLQGELNSGYQSFDFQSPFTINDAIFLVSVNEDIVERPGEKPQTAQTPKAADNDAIHDGNARTGTPDVSRASKPTVLTFQVSNGRLRYTFSKNKVDWNPNYEDLTSYEYKQLRDKFCESLLHAATKVVPDGSDGGKCVNVSFAPANLKRYEKRLDSEVLATAKLLYAYPDVPNVEINMVLKRFRNQYKESWSKYYISATNAKFSISVNEDIVERPGEKPQTAQTPKAADNDAIHDGNARTGTPDVSRASKPTVLVVEVFTAKLMIARTKQNLKWYPTYENKHSQEFQQLSNEVCEALLQYANSIVPTGSDGGKCENPIFIPTYGTPYAAVSTKLKIVFEYINVPRIEAKLLQGELNSGYQSFDFQSPFTINDAIFLVSVNEDIVERPGEKPQTAQTPKAADNDAISVNEDIVERPGEKPQTAQTPKAADNDAIHDGNARTGTPDVSRASKPTVYKTEAESSIMSSHNLTLIITKIIALVALTMIFTAGAMVVFYKLA